MNLLWNYLKKLRVSKSIILQFELARIKVHKMYKKFNWSFSFFSRTSERNPFRQKTSPSVVYLLSIRIVQEIKYETSDMKQSQCVFKTSRGKSLLELWVTTFLPDWQRPLIFVRLGCPKNGQFSQSEKFNLALAFLNYLGQKHSPKLFLKIFEHV